jgi:hypothetical protein
VLHLLRGSCCALNALRNARPTIHACTRFICGGLVATFAERAWVGTPWANPFREEEPLALKVSLKRHQARARIGRFKERLTLRVRKLDHATNDVRKADWIFSAGEAGDCRCEKVIRFV